MPHMRTIARRLLAVALVTAAASAAAASGAAASDWTQYLGGPQHSSANGSTVVTTANAARVHQIWHWTPPAVSGKPAPRLDGSPTVVGGSVYIGSATGVFYAIDAATGTVRWRHSLDTQAQLTCPARGISATAAVVRDPVGGRLTVYAAGARYLYALDPATGALRWKRLIGGANPPGQNAYYNWSSPTVVAGHIYMGISSNCDKPLVRGGVVELAQHTGAVLHTWYTVPPGSIGGSVWSSVAASWSGGDVWASTGNECDPTVNACPAGNRIGDSLSIVHLNGSLGRLQGWQVPGIAGGGRDSDFGSSPTVFAGASDVGACNKNGRYYALTARPLSAQPLWSAAIGAPSEAGAGVCIASAVWSIASSRLYVAGNGTTIGGTSYAGSVRQLLPATGAVVWERGLPCSVFGTPSIDASGVIAVATYGSCATGASPAAYLLDADDGAILAQLPVGGSKVFAQPVFAGNALYVASETSGLYAFAP